MRPIRFCLRTKWNDWCEKKSWLTIINSIYGRRFNLLTIMNVITKATEIERTNCASEMTQLNSLSLSELRFAFEALLWLVMQSLLMTTIDRSLKHSPANNIRPINSLRPMLSKSITMTSNEHSRIFSHGTLKLNESLKCGFNVHLKMGVFRFSIRLSPNWSQTLT